MTKKLCTMCGRTITNPRRRYGITCDDSCDKILERRASKIGMKMVRGTPLQVSDVALVTAIRMRSRLHLAFWKTRAQNSA